MPSPERRPLVECVPNFSEGRRPEVIEAIVAAAAGVAGATVLDCESDPTHNRMVLTLVGGPAAMVAAALAAGACAVARIDLTRHAGQHPRMGAVDVVPFVPLRDVSLEDCAELARGFGAAFAERCGVPVFLYEAAATRPGRRDLAEVRRGQFEGLRSAIGSDPEREPDFGPSRIHPTAGATAVGARPILIAYNVNLATGDLGAARAIARAIRERDGGLPAVKALGFALPEQDAVQVSMNLTDFHRTSVEAAFSAVAAAAAARGLTVRDSEVVGLVPLEAVVPAARRALQLSGFAAEQVIEHRLLALMTAPGDPQPDRSSLGAARLTEFATRVAARDPVPGGGSVAAYGGALAASLVTMVGRLTLGKKGYEAVQENIQAIVAESVGLGSRLLELVDEDAHSFEAVAAALKLPRASEAERRERSQCLRAALRGATEVPARTMEVAHRVWRLATAITEIGNRSARSDAETATGMARAALTGAWSNVRLNLEGLSADPDFVEATTRRLLPLLEETTAAV
ncbi:MAG TPA: glutamate formimidoyltransferase [Verrucomicrobiae bacterium]|nr:glutamate formimidoyltransferase [Verrucomicrobiae bacterium]